MKLVSVDGGPKPIAASRTRRATVLATVMIPFEQMGKAAVDAIDTIVVQKKPKTR